MKELLEALGIWKVPTCIVSIIFILFIFMQVTGELIEWKGKVAPEILKIRKYFKRKKEERGKKDKLLEDVQTLLDEINKHYDNDNITKRNNWMTDVNSTITWVHDRADHYDKSIEKISSDLSLAAQALASNTELTEEIFVQNSRDRIIEFAERAGDYDLIISREEFNRIFKVYTRYEEFLEKHNRENGEIETNYAIIKDGYDYRARHHSFLEDIRTDLKLNKKNAD